MRQRALAVRVLLLAIGLAAWGWLLWIPSQAGDSGTGAAASLQSASPSPSPSGTQAPSPSPSPSPSPTMSADPSYRRLTLRSSRREVRVGKEVILRGRLSANRLECSVGSRVIVRRKIFGTSRSFSFAETRTDGEGDFRVRDHVRWSSLYHAVAPSAAGCRRERSEPVAVYSHVWFSVKVSDRTPRRGTNFRIHGRVRPSHPNSQVTLQQRRGRRWVTVQRQDLSARSSFSFFPQAAWRGERNFRLRWPKADPDHETGSSRVVAVTTHP